MGMIGAFNSDNLSFIKRILPENTLNKDSPPTTTTDEFFSKSNHNNFTNNDTLYDFTAQQNYAEFLENQSQVKIYQTGIVIENSNTNTQPATTQTSENGYLSVTSDTTVKDIQNFLAEQSQRIVRNINTSIEIPYMEGGSIIAGKIVDGTREYTTDKQPSVFYGNGTEIERNPDSPVIIYPDGRIGFYQKEDGAYCELSADGSVLFREESKIPSLPNEGSSRTIKTVSTSVGDFSYIKTMVDIREQLVELGAKYGFSVSLNNDRDIWIEDSTILLPNDKTYIPCTYTKHSVEISTRESRANSIGQKNWQASSQGRVYDRKVTLDAVPYEKRIYGQSYLEGGNVLACRNSQGEPAIIIGEESIDFTMNAMGFLDLESRILNYKLDNNIDIYDDLTAYVIADLKETMSVEAETAKLEAIEQIAKDLGVSAKNITFIPQFDFHIDMWYRPLGDGVFGVPDFDSALEIVMNLLNHPTDLSENQIQDLEKLQQGLMNMKDNLGIQTYMKEAEKRLTDSGFNIQPIPCFSILKGLRGQYNDDDTYPLINYMNGIAATASTEEGISPDIAGKPYFITNSSGISQLDDAIKNYFIENNIFNSVDFISHDLLARDGGLDCITLEYLE